MRTGPVPLISFVRNLHVIFHPRATDGPITIRPGLIKIGTSAIHLLFRLATRIATRVNDSDDTVGKILDLKNDAITGITVVDTTLPFLSSLRAIHGGMVFKPANTGLRTGLNIVLINRHRLRILSKISPIKDRGGTKKINLMINRGRSAVMKDRLRTPRTTNAEAVNIVLTRLGTRDNRTATPNAGFAGIVTVGK